MEDKNLQKIEKNSFKRIKQQIGFILLALTAIYFLVCSIFIDKTFNVCCWQSITKFILLLSILFSLFLILDFTQILFDPNEQEANMSKRELVIKLRFRAILFNNIAIILFLFTFIIIIICFYILIHSSEKTSDGIYWINNFTLRIGSSILLIFLVQIFFKVFKYILRVAAFYNARADAIEFVLLDESKELEKLMDQFTPDKYDISELDKIDLFGDLLNSFKGKL